MPLSTRVWRTTVNWLDANRIGMTFSFLFGPAALTFLATLRRRRTNSVYLNTLFGAAAGMPLAVCTNCVAPIARGFYASGMSTESVLAAMFASPALNVVVLAMTFALFPVPDRAPQARHGSLPDFRLRTRRSLTPRSLHPRRRLPHRNPRLRDLDASARFHHCALSSKVSGTFSASPFR